MCGFTGFYALKDSRSRAECDSIARAMMDTLVHRGPDFGDVWQDPNVCLVLGHRRLSILDLSPEGQQPMVSADGRYVIVFNGEIYNHLELRREYLNGDSFRGHSDTETLLALFGLLGFEETLNLINGMFAFALWDRQGRILHFVRDRHGKKPLYLGWAGDSLVFGSELKSLHAYPDFNTKIDRYALALYTRYGFVAAPHTIYQGIWQLPPGHSLSLCLDTIKLGQDLKEQFVSYWSADAVAREAPSNVDYDVVGQFETLLSACVQDRMLSDVPLGAFLSGGIDSSTIVALMQKQSDAPVHTYTIGFDEAGFDEAVHAREVAKHLGTDHHEHYCSPQDALDVIPKLPDIYDEPFADQSAIPTFLVSQFARQDVTVALSGDGGDEMLGGYSRHVSTPKIKNLPSFTRHGINSVPPFLLKTLFPHKPLLGKHLQKVSAVLSADTCGDIYDALLSQWVDTPVLEHSDAHLSLKEMHSLTLAEQLMLWDAQYYMPHDILTKVDRASMAVSLEVRAPLLDHRVFEFAWGLPMDVKIRDGKGKWLLREVLARHVPRALFERPKQGFNIPVGQWLRNDLRDWAEDLLDPQTLSEQGLFDAKTIRNVWDAHIKRRGHYDEALWSVLMFQAWYRRWQ